MPTPGPISSSHSAQVLSEDSRRNNEFPRRLVCPATCPPCHHLPKASGKKQSRLSTGRIRTWSLASPRLSNCGQPALFDLRTSPAVPPLASPGLSPPGGFLISNGGDWRGKAGRGVSAGRPSWETCCGSAQLAIGKVAPSPSDAPN